MDAVQPTHHISSLVKELSAQTGITEEQAQKVLQALRIDILIENTSNMRQVLKDEPLARLWGYLPEQAEMASQALSPERFSLANIGLAYFNPNFLKVTICV